MDGWEDLIKTVSSGVTEPGMLCSYHILARIILPGKTANIHHRKNHLWVNFIFQSGKYSEYVRP
jgi:hypothetical protein